jgi:hypothetical protein
MTSTATATPDTITVIVPTDCDSHAVYTLDDGRGALAGLICETCERVHLAERDTPALTYAERTLRAGNWGDGFRAGFLLDRAMIRQANAKYAAHRRIFGYTGTARMLTAPEAQAKLRKSDRYALGLMLSPADSTPEDVTTVAGIRRRFTLCANASAGCRAACLAYSGHGQFTATQRARQVRTAFLLAAPYHAGVLIGAETRRALEAHGPDRITLRLNVLSDIRWEYVGADALALATAYGVRLYDYTAHAPEDRDPRRIPGYALTYSAKETAHTSDAYLAGILRAGETVAVPFHVAKGHALPTHYTLAGSVFVVIDGDESDDRTEDPRGVIVGLRAKGPRGKADASGFIRDPYAGGWQASSWSLDGLEPYGPTSSTPRTLGGAA